MDYSNAIIDANVVTYPETPPDPGRAGSVIIDPFCGNRILRVTDADTDADKPGALFTTPSSSTANPWNSDSTSFVLLDKDSSYYLYDFDDALAANPRGRLARNFRNCYFSAMNPNLLWGYTGELKLELLDISTGVSTVVVDFNDYPELGIPAEPRWYLNGFSVDMFDQRVCVQLGPGQDKNPLAVIWDVELGLAWLNTQTGEFGGWCQGSIPNWDPFLLHFAGMNKTGSAVLMGPPVSGDIRFWQPGTSIFKAWMASETVPTYGHNAIGCQNFYGMHAGGPFNWIQAPLWDLELCQPLVPTLDYPADWWTDFHMSIQPDTIDRHPLLISTENVQGNPATPGAPLTSACAADNEILALAADGSCRFWRLAHHYSTSKNENFWSKPRGNVSQDGRFFMFTSDWEITLGGDFPKQRTDVFILETTRH